MQRSLYIDPEKCTGCLQCEMARSYENEGAFNPAKSPMRRADNPIFGIRKQYARTICAQNTQSDTLRASN